MMGLLVACIVLLSVLLIVLVVTLVVFAGSIGRAINRLEDTLTVVRDSIVPVAEDTRILLTDTDALVRSARAQINRIDGITTQVENLLEGRTVTDAASRVVSSSRATLGSVLAAVKEGLKALRNARDRSKEEPSNE